MRRLKKAQTGMIFFPVIAFILGLAMFFLFVSPDIDDAIGQKQGALLKAIPEGELTLSYIDSSARLSAWDSVVSLGDDAGFYQERTTDERVLKNYPCGVYVYGKWALESKDCWPTKNVIENAFTSYFSDHLISDYLRESTFDIPMDLEYDYVINPSTNNLKISGITSSVISKQVSYEVSSTAPAKSNFPTEKPSDESLTKCCTGECVVELAQAEVEKYGATGKKLPYVWGGSTPYNIQDTRKASDEANSFFNGVIIFEVQPEGNEKREGKPMVPGFDCSGFMWWVYKHAQISEFSQRHTSTGFRDLFSNKKEYLICEYADCKKAIADKIVKPGDIIIRDSISREKADHIAMYAGDGMIIDSSTDHPQVGIQKRLLPDIGAKSWYPRIKIYRPTYNQNCEAKKETTTNTDVDNDPINTKEVELWYPNANRISPLMKSEGIYRNEYPEGAVIHYAAEDSVATVQKIAYDREFSYFIIDENAQVHQGTPLNEWGSHAGPDSFKKDVGPESASRYLVGIEIVNWGKLDKKNGGLYSHKNVLVPESESRTVSKKGSIREAGNYHKFTPEQEKALMELLFWLKNNNPSVFDFNNVVGHDELSNQKIDPGGSLSMTMSEYRKMLNEKFVPLEPEDVSSSSVSNTVTVQKSNTDNSQSNSDQNLPEVGILSAKYESAKTGSLAVGYDTTGKTSYGKYQISSPTMSQFLKFAEKKKPSVFLKLSKAGSPNCEYACSPTGCYSSDNRKNTCSPSECYVKCEFAQVWKNLASSGELGDLEHEFIKSKHYDPAVNAIEKSIPGININSRSFALQNVVWSMAVQHGPSSAANIFIKAGIKIDMKDDEIIKEVYGERKNVDKYFASSTPAVKRSVLNRFEAEEKDALDMLKNGVKGKSITSDSTQEYFTQKDFGYYDVNPSFTTEINYDLSVYDKIANWLGGVENEVEDISNIEPANNDVEPLDPTISDDGMDIILLFDKSTSMRWSMNEFSGFAKTPESYGFYELDCSKVLNPETKATRQDVAACLSYDLNALILDSTKPQDNRVWVMYFMDYAHFYNYNSYRHTYDPFTTPKNLEMVNKIIDANIVKRIPAGDSCICCGLNKAYEVLSSASKSTRKKAIVVLSDGVTEHQCPDFSTSGKKVCFGQNPDVCSNNDCEKSINSAVLSAERLNKDLGVTVYGIGVGPMDSCSKAVETLTRISEAGNGKYFASSDSSKFFDYLQNQEISKVSNQKTDDIKKSVELSVLPKVEEKIPAKIICSGYQKSTSECIENKTAEQNKKYDEFMARTDRKPDEISFKFIDPSICDGADSGFYSFVETFEDCLDLGKSSCICKPKPVFMSIDEELNISAKTLSKRVIATGVKTYYDLSREKEIIISVNNQIMESFQIKKTGSKYDLILPGNKIEVYNVVFSRKEIDNKIYLDFLTTGSDKKEICVFDAEKTNFRFCAVSSQKIPVYDQDSQKYSLNQIPIKFSLNIKSAPPPSITAQSIETGTTEAVATNVETTDPNGLCLGFSDAEIDLKAMSKDLVCNYEKFAGSLSELVPTQVKIATFLANFLKIGDLPAAISVTVDFKDAQGCDISGMVYKCGLGVPPVNPDGSIDFSNPDGFVDLKEKFSRAGTVEKDAQGNILLKNPDGKIATKASKLILPTYSEDKKTMSFIVSDCQEKITQFKKPDSFLDILKYASMPNGYYFVFAYMKPDGTYGKTTVKSVFIAPVLDQLYKQIGFASQLLYLKDTIILDATSHYKSLLGQAQDQTSMFEKALGSRSFDDLLKSMGVDAKKEFLEKAAANMDLNGAKEMFNRAANMKLPYDQARELLNPLLDKLDASEARNILNSAVAKSSELKDEMYASLSNLPRPEKEDLLKKLNPNIDWSKLSDSEINQKLREIVSSKPDLEKLMQYLPDATALETVKDLIREAPDKMMGVVNEAISEARKLELIKEGMLKDVNSQISSALAHISPDRIKGLALEEFSKGSLDVCGETFHPLDWVQ